MRRARIAGTGSYVPEKVVTNHDLEQMVDTSDEWITTRTGIKERRIAGGETAADMAVESAERAIKSAGLEPGAVDLVIVGTVTPDLVFPSTACLVQNRLGLRSGIPAFDVSAACSGFLYALNVADKYIKSGASTNALVIGVDLFSRIVDWTDRSTCVLFGDGAGAVVLRASNGQSGLLSSHIHSDGSYWQVLYTPGALGRDGCKKDGKGPCVVMKGNETFKIAIRTMEEAVKEVMDTNGLAPSDISLFIPHQANMRIIKALREKLGIPDDRVFSNIERYGNTSAGSIPIALDEAVRGGLVKSGDIIVFASFGGGLVWASAAVRW